MCQSKWMVDSSTKEIAETIIKDCEHGDDDWTIYLKMEDCGEDGTGVIEVDWMEITQGHLIEMAKAYLSHAPERRKV